MNLIEQRNKEIAKERAKREQEEEEATSVYASVKAGDQDKRRVF